MLLEEILQRHRASRVAPVYDLERLWNSWQYIHRTHSPSFETFKNETVLFLSRHKRTHTPTEKHHVFVPSGDPQGISVRVRLKLKQWPNEKERSSRVGQSVATNSNLKYFSGLRYSLFQ